MALIVQKFGGTSVADLDRIRHVATHVRKELAKGNQLIVVVSAMAGVTDQLVGYASAMSDLQSEEARADYDMIVSSGEQVTSGLLALYLQSQGIPARSWAGWQIPMHTSGIHSKARIEQIDTQAVKASLEEGKVAVVAGFQGIMGERVSTLGRGGSDTTAVALAAAFDAERCDIYTDVDGIYTCDPRLVPKARKLKTIAYEEILELASLGAKVLQTRSVELAMNHGVRVQVLSTFKDVPGTLLVDEEEIVEKERVTGIAYSRDEARVTLVNVENIPGVSAAIFGPLADKGINVDMIIQNVTEKGDRTDVTFTVPRGDLELTLETMKRSPNMPKHDVVHTDDKVCKVSVVGVGMRSHAGVAKEMFQTLADHAVNIIVISTSEIKISTLIDEKNLEIALRALHTAYGLDAVEEKEETNVRRQAG